MAEPADDPSRGLGGAGRAGGVLFLAVILFLAYLVLTALTGLFRIVAFVGLLTAIVLLGVNVAHRR
jgi:hypothetical protein